MYYFGGDVVYYNGNNIACSGWGCQYLIAGEANEGKRFSIGGSMK